MRSKLTGWKFYLKVSPGYSTPSDCLLWREIQANVYEISPAPRWTIRESRCVGDRGGFYLQIRWHAALGMRRSAKCQLHSTQWWAVRGRSLCGWMIFSSCSIFTCKTCSKISWRLSDTPAAKRENIKRCELWRGGAAVKWSKQVSPNR